jgi:hypothetical protein
VISVQKPAARHRFHELIIDKPNKANEATSFSAVYFKICRIRKLWVIYVGGLREAPEARCDPRAECCHKIGR